MIPHRLQMGMSMFTLSKWRCCSWLLSLFLPKGTIANKTSGRTNKRGKQIDTDANTKLGGKWVFTRRQVRVGRRRFRAASATNWRSITAGVQMVPCAGRCVEHAWQATGDAVQIDNYTCITLRRQVTTRPRHMLPLLPIRCRRWLYSGTSYLPRDRPYLP